jgi:hypothetical protein
MNTILDTNIYRGYNTVDLEALLKRCSVVPFLSPLNVLEILGLDGSDEKDFVVRRAAAQKMLRVCRGPNGSIRWIEDPEAFQAKLLGCCTTQYDFQQWEEALNRLAQAEMLEDLSDAQSIINYSTARSVRENAYKKFVAKLKEIKKVYEDWFKKSAITDVAPSDRGLIFAAMEGVQSFCHVRTAEFNRVRDVAIQVQAMVGTASKSVCGAPNPSLLSRLNPYTELYIEYVVQYVDTGHVDKNDFGDLQFAIYCGGGYALLTNEKQWPRLADRTSLAGLVLSVQELEVAAASNVKVKAQRSSWDSRELLVGVMIGATTYALLRAAAEIIRGQRE